jgi:hypothetical protein
LGSKGDVVDLLTNLLTNQQINYVPLRRLRRGPNGATTAWRFYDDSGAYHNGYIAKMTTPDGATVYELEAGTNLLKSVTDPLLRKTSKNKGSNL